VRTWRNRVQQCGLELDGIGLFWNMFNYSFDLRFACYFVFFSLFIEIYIAQWTRSLMFGYGCLFYMNENIDFDDRENLTFNFIDIEGRSHTTTLHFLKTNWSNNFAVHADRETLYKFNP
jgi:hypothetical protein